MSLLARIQADALAARKAREIDTATLLVTLYAEAAKVGKDKANRDSTDSEVLAVVRKFVSNNDDTLRALWTPEKLDTNVERAARRDKLQLEQSVLSAYLPTETPLAEIEAAVTELVATLPDRSPKQQGVLMKTLTARFGDALNKQTAAAVARKALT